MAHLGGLVGLRTLNLAGTSITDAGLAHLKDATGLRYFHLSDCEKVGDAGLAGLKGLKQLEFLSLSGQPRVTDAGLAHLTELTKLKDLHLDQTRITGAGLAHLGKMKELRLLSLSGCPVGDDIADLKGLTQLKTLNLSDGLDGPVLVSFAPSSR